MTMVKEGLRMVGIEVKPETMRRFNSRDDDMKMTDEVSSSKLEVAYAQINQIEDVKEDAEEQVKKKPVKKKRSTVRSRLVI